MEKRIEQLEKDLGAAHARLDDLAKILSEHLYRVATVIEGEGSLNVKENKQ